MAQGGAGGLAAEAAAAAARAGRPGAAQAARARNGPLQVRQRPPPFLIQKGSFCQDRLGTNIGKALKKESVAFFLKSVSSFPYDCPEPVLVN